MRQDIVKYPRTPHLQGSRLQPGDVDDGLPLASLPDGDWVWEEKLDGANTGISFDEDGEMVIQSRGHALQGGTRERQFDQLKAWASAKEDMLFDVLGSRFVAYFEWMAAKHTIFYDALPHLAFEEDVLDKQTGCFLPTQRRHAMFEGTGVMHVPIVHRGRLAKPKHIDALVVRSLYQTEQWRSALASAANNAGVPPDLALVQTDDSDRAEGLYLKIEDGERVVQRAKWVRTSFVQTIIGSGSHWQSRPLIENALLPGASILANEQDTLRP